VTAPPWRGHEALSPPGSLHPFVATPCPANGLFAVRGDCYCRKLLQAGVPVVGPVNLGLTHPPELIYRQAVPEEHFAAVRDINRFAQPASEPRHRLSVPAVRRPGRHDHCGHGWENCSQGQVLARPRIR